MIDSYKFGKMIIDGKHYDQDLIIFPTHVQAGWWRENGHSLVPEDLETVFEYGPEVLVVGTGNVGMMKIPEHTINVLKERGIECVARKTGKAVQEYNQRSSKENVVAAFHLTC